MWRHWVARACTPQVPFEEFESARWFWAQLRELFPGRVAAVLMPNHFHLILPRVWDRTLNGTLDRAVNGTLAGTLTEEKTLRLYNGLLRAMSLRLGVKNLWQPRPQPTDIPDVFHLRRQIRYLALNPCRKNLCADPLEWYWSTYRDVMGAAAESDLSAAGLAHILNEPAQDFEVRFHRYVSGDPSVHVAGTPFPQPAAPIAVHQVPETAIREILAAAAGALRVARTDVQRRSFLRRVFIHLAYQQGWRRPTDLAQFCKITPNAVRLILKKQCPPSVMRASALCLGDNRLRRWSGADGFLGHGRDGQHVTRVKCRVSRARS